MRDVRRVHRVASGRWRGSRRSGSGWSGSVTNHPPQRLVLLSLLAAVLGLAAGGTAWVLVRLIAILTNLTLFHRWGTSLPSFADLPLSPLVVVVAVAGAAIVALLALWAPIIRGHGIPEAMDAVLTQRS